MTTLAERKDRGHDPWFLSKLLGPLHKMWQRWTPAEERFLEFDVDHFIKTLRHQCDELEEIRDDPNRAPGDRMAFAKEFADGLSVSLNGLRWCTRGDVRQVVKSIDDRNTRYVDPHAIIDKYIAEGWG